MCESCQGDSRLCSEFNSSSKWKCQDPANVFANDSDDEIRRGSKQSATWKWILPAKDHSRESRWSLSALHSLRSSQVPLHLMNSEQRKTAQHRHPGKWGWVALGEESSKNKNGQCLLEQKPGVGKKCPVSAMGHSKGHVPHLLHEVGNATDQANIPNLKSLNLKCSKT